MHQSKNNSHILQEISTNILTKMSDITGSPNWAFWEKCKQKKIVTENSVSTVCDKTNLTGQCLCAVRLKLKLTCVRLLLKWTCVSYYYEYNAASNIQHWWYCVVVQIFTFSQVSIDLKLTSDLSHFRWTFNASCCNELHGVF